MEFLKKCENSRVMSWILVVFSLGMLGLTLIRCNNHVFIPDECYTVMLSTWSWKEILVETANDFHPPLYHLMTTIVYRILGWGAPVYRLFSFLPYVIEIILVNVVVRKMLGAISSAVIISMLTFNTANIIYNVQATCYSWVSLFVMCFFLCLFRVLSKQEDKLAWVGLVITSLLVSYTHYYGFLDVAILYGITFIWAFIFDKKLWKRVSVAIGVSMVGYLPWIIIAFRSYGKLTSGDSWLKHMTMTIMNCWESWYSWSWLVYIAIVSFVIYILRYIKEIDKAEPEKVWVFIGTISLFFVIAIPKTISLFSGNILVTRYLFPVVVVAEILLVAQLNRFRIGKLIQLVIFVFTLVFGIQSYEFHYTVDSGMDKDHLAFLDEIKLEKDINIVGDQLAYTWSVLPYYYPDNPMCGLEDWLEHYDPDTAPVPPEKQVLFCYLGMQPYIEQELEKKGLRAIYWYTGTLGAMEHTEVYRIERVLN